MEATDIYLRIKQAREHSGLTQSSLAILVGVKRSSANQWESSILRKEPSTGNLIKIAEITGVSFEWLATGRGEMMWGKIKESTAEYNPLTPREILLLKLFKNLPERKQKALLDFLSGS
ncbi:MAG: helix-turn-helix domain-containing protein [Methylovulum sp.]|nr:MAG: helix-turn-helix domain-containing protein [Methylovulum sp.]